MAWEALHVTYSRKQPSVVKPGGGGWVGDG